MIKPFDARVVVKKPKREEQTASGIIIPDSIDDQKQTERGVVVGVGQGSRNMNTGERMEIPIKVGDTILYTKFQGIEVKDDGEDFKKYLETINRQIKDIEKLVNEFSDFARMPSPILKKIKIDSVIKRAVDFYKMAHQDLKLSYTTTSNDSFLIKGHEP